MGTARLSSELFIYSAGTLFMEIISRAVSNGELPENFYPQLEIAKL